MNKWNSPVDLLAALAAWEPERTFSCGVVYWSTLYEPSDRRDRRYYNASVHPGFKGDTCDVFSAVTLEGLCADIMAARDAARQPAPVSPREAHEAQGGIELLDYADDSPAPAQS